MGNINSPPYNNIIISYYRKELSNDKNFCYILSLAVRAIIIIFYSAQSRSAGI